MDKKRDFFFILLIFSLTILFFSKILFGSYLFAYRDFHRYFYPMRLFASSWIREGIIPFWNPYLHSGIPFLADLQSAIFYPFSLLTYLLPYHLSLKLFVVVQLILAGFFIYLFLKELRISKTASFVGSITFIFSGYVLSTLDMLIYLSTLMWTPLLFLFFNKALNQLTIINYQLSIINYQLSIINFKWALLCGISLGLMFLGADPTGLYQTLWALLFFAIAKVVARSTEHRAQGLRSRLSLLIAHCSLLIAAGLIALGLTLFQALPFLEFISFSSRSSGIDYAEAARWSFSPLELISFVFPLVPSQDASPFFSLNSQGWLSSPYFGILPLLLAFIAIFLNRCRKSLFFGALFLGSIILSFGSFLPGYHLLHKYLPFFSMMRYPVKFLFMTIFAGAILSAIGFDHLLKTFSLKRESSKSSILKLIFYFNLFLLSLWLTLLLNKEMIVSYLWKTHFLGAGPDQFPGLLKWCLSVFNNFGPILILSLLAFLLLLLNRIGKLSLKLLTFFLVVIIISDLFLAGVNLLWKVDERLYQYKPASLEFLLKEKGDFRTFLTPRTGMFFRKIRGKTFSKALINVQETLVPNLCLPYHLFDFSGYTSLRVKDYEKFSGLISTSNFSSISHLLSMANVKYLITKWAMNEEGLKLVYDQKGVKIYENLSVLPRAFFVPKARVIKEREEILEFMLSRDFDPGREVILEAEDRGQKTEGRRLLPTSHFPLPTSHFRAPAFAGRPASHSLEYQPNKVIIQDFVAPADGFLFLSDTYYPDWKAYVDGTETRIFRANYTFRAIQIKEGRRRVEFIYQPKSFTVGLIGTGFTVLLLLIYPIASYRFKRT